MAKPNADKDLVLNRKARHDYAIGDRFEAGIALVGTEVKSIRNGRANLQEAYVRLDQRGAWLVGCHISPYEQGNQFNHDPVRERQLLLNRHELLKLARQTRETGTTIVPLRIYLKGRRIKVEIAVGTGKKQYDKRQALKAKAAKRDMERSRR